MFAFQKLQVFACFTQQWKIQIAILYKAVLDVKLKKCEKATEKGVQNQAFVDANMPPLVKFSHLQYTSSL